MEYKKTIILLALVVFLLSIAGVSASEIGDTIASENANTIELSTDNDIEDNLQTSEENEALASTDYDEAIAQTDTDVLGADSATYSYLAEEISQPGNINLTHKSYTYDGGETITISEDNKVIDGNGAVIDMNGSTIRAFHVSASGVTIKNLTIKNANYYDDGGAIYFTSSGTVTNCNFVNNSARYGGAVFFSSTGTVSNCNFTNSTVSEDGGAVCFLTTGTVSNCNFADNKATRDGGAVCFFDHGTVTNCNFTDNKATRDGGAVYFLYHGTVTNCNFTDNTATGDGGAVFFTSYGTHTVSNCNFVDNKATGDYGRGGAVYFNGTGEVTNCNFTDNTATGDGGAIYSMQGYTTADTCIFKRNSGDNVNTVIYPPTLNVDDFTTVYSSGEKLTFDLKTNSSIPVTNGNILISVYFKDNGEWVRNYTCLSGEGWIPDLPVGSYIAVFDTEYADFRPINRTITVMPDNTFMALNNLINNNGLSEINLTKDYHFDPDLDSEFKNGIVINNNVIIDGQGHTIDAQSQARILDLQQGKTILKNITFKNGSQSYFFGGGAIRCVALVEITNCTFINNHAPSGGAVQLQGWDNVISDCVFIGNTADRGAAIELSAAAYNTITGCVFYDNDIFGSQANGCEINNNIFFNSIIAFDWTQNYNIDNNWFGNNATNYDEKPVAEDYNIKSWLFLNATANPDTISIFDVSNIIFKLYMYNPTSGEISEYDHNLLYPINLTVTANNGSIDKNTVKLGEAITYDPSALGSGNVTASIENAIYTINLNIVKANSTLTVDDMTFDYNSTGSTIISFTNASGVNASVVGQPDAIVKVNGTNITVSGLNAGTYTLTVTTIPDENYNPVTENATITVNKLKTELTGAAVTATYNVNKDLVITLKDSKGIVLSGVSVTVDLNGAKTYTTDKNGQVKVSTKGLAPKAYTAKVTFNGDTNYDKSTKDIKVTVKKATPKLTAKNKTFKTTTKTKKYTITLKDNTGKAIKKAKVTLKVKGKTYKATTNSKGKATFKIKKLNKKGTFKATITYKGNKYYNKVSKKAKIKVIVTFKTVSKGSKDKSTVKEIQRALKDHGYYLSYKGHYLKVDGKFKGCTERSVKEFQHDKGLKVTGKVDEKTAKKLGLI